MTSRYDHFNEQIMLTGSNAKCIPERRLMMALETHIISATKQ